MARHGGKGTRVRRHAPTRRLTTSFHHAVVRTAKTEAEMAAGRQAVLIRHPVRTLEAFTAAELAALRAKLEGYLARHEGLPVPVARSDDTWE